MSHISPFHESVLIMTIKRCRSARTKHSLLGFIILWLFCLLISEEHNNVLYGLYSGSKRRKHTKGTLVCRLLSGLSLNRLSKMTENCKPWLWGQIDKSRAPETGDGNHPLSKRKQLTLPAIKATISTLIGSSMVLMYRIGVCKHIKYNEKNEGNRWSAAGKHYSHLLRWSQTRPHMCTSSCRSLCSLWTWIWSDC